MRPDKGVKHVTLQERMSSKSSNTFYIKCQYGCYLAIGR